MDDNSIRIDYNQSLKPLEELLEGVERDGSFFVNGVVEIPMPNLEIEGLGVLSFPVPPAQIATLIQQATRAPYGRGEQTILDESVRKVWQLTPNQLRIGGKSWAANFDRILTRVTAGLGCGGIVVSAELYKLLVYDQGGFFLPHRDTEKVDGMFATLVITLPSAHRGGELIIRHAGLEAIVDPSGAEGSEVTFTAFYADCEHEVRPITEGNRVCLVYNLLQPTGAHDHHSPLAPDYIDQIAAATELLKRDLSRAGAPVKIAWLLEHQYIPDGLTFAALKSADAARARVLLQATELAGCAAHLGIVHIEEAGSAEEIHANYRPRRRSSSRDRDEEETEDVSSDDFEIIDIADSRHYISQWRDRQDRAMAFGEIPLQPAELLPAGALDNEPPDEQRLMEASGNAGVSFERAYHRAAFVIWRHERYAEVLLQAGLAAVLPHLRERMAVAEAPNAPPAACLAAVALARQLVTAWRATLVHPGYPPPTPPAARNEMLSLLNQLGDTALLETFIGEIVIRDYDGSDNAGLVASTQRLDASKTASLYAELIRRHLGYRPGSCIDLLHTLTFHSKTTLNTVARSAVPEIAEAVVSNLDAVGMKSTSTERGDWWVSENARAVDSAFVTKLLAALAAVDRSRLRADAVEKLTARPDAFDPVTILLPTLTRIREHDAPVARLWEHCTAHILLRCGLPPIAPQDWREDVSLGCSCGDCRELQEFMHHPAQQSHRFRVRLDRRQHLHQMIERHRLEITHVTERQGSPQTLVCTKDRRGYRRRCEQYRTDITALTSLAELASKFDVAAASLARIKVARELAERWRSPHPP